LRRYKKNGTQGQRRAFVHLAVAKSAKADGLAAAYA